MVFINITAKVKPMTWVGWGWIWLRLNQTGGIARVLPVLTKSNENVVRKKMKLYTYLIVCTATPGLDVVDFVVVTVVVNGMFSSYFQLQFSRIRIFGNLKTWYYNFTIFFEMYQLGLASYSRAILRSESKKLSIITSRIDLIIVELPRDYIESTIIYKCFGFPSNLSTIFEAPIIYNSVVKYLKSPFKTPFGFKTDKIYVHVLSKWQNTRMFSSCTWKKLSELKV